MRKKGMIASLVLAAVALFSACSSDTLSTDVPDIKNNPENAATTAYFGVAKMVVPVGTDKIYVEYTDAAGNMIEKPVNVTPKTDAPDAKKGLSPFRELTLKMNAQKPTKISVYHRSNQKDAKVYVLENVVLEAIPVTAGEFGKTRYVSVDWNHAYYMGGEYNSVTMKYTREDVVVDATYTDKNGLEQTTSLTYRFGHTGPNAPAYYLVDAYNIDTEGNATAKDGYANYCGGCSNCPYCMPWGCSCSCGAYNDAFHPDGGSSAGEGGSGEGDSGEGEGGSGEGGASTDPEVIKIDLGRNVEPYVTSDEDQTFYHSSGVVMFDDSWPTVPKSATDHDYNDVVLDYDIEAKTVDIAKIPNQAWREQIKVVLHVRAMGGEWPTGAGLLIDGLTEDFVDSVETYVTLDSWQNPHGEWPAIVTQKITGKQTYLPEGSDMFINGLQNYCDGNLAKATYTRIDDNGQTHEMVVNRAAAGLQRDETQYDPEVITDHITKMFYNTNPGYVNVDGGLLTFTFIYHTKDRTVLSVEEAEAQLQKMIDVVVKTDKQNFYMIAQNQREIHLPGYAPRSTYQSSYDATVAGKGDLAADNTYLGTAGYIWGFKSPVLTRHAWERYGFEQAYPYFDEWVNSKGQEHSDWYLDLQDVYLSCWW